jgi:hypothetical protein
MVLGYVATSHIEFGRHPAEGLHFTAFLHGLNMQVNSCAMYLCKRLVIWIS